MRSFRAWIFRGCNLILADMNKRSELAFKVGVEIRRLRKERGHSQEGFADECGIQRSYMGAIERGEKVMSIDMTKRVVTTLGLTLGQFFMGIEE